MYDLFLQRFFDLIILNHCHNSIGEERQTLRWWHMLDFSSHLVHLNLSPSLHNWWSLHTFFDFSKPNQQPMYSIEPSPCTYGVCKKLFNDWLARQCIIQIFLSSWNFSTCAEKAFEAYILRSRQSSHPIRVTWCKFVSLHWLCMQSQSNPEFFFFFL